MNKISKIILEEIQLFHNDLLIESISDIMFHFTYVYKLYGILKSNEILLSPGFINPADNKDKSLYFLSLSTSRSMNAGYGASLGSNGIARLTMNGRTLNQNYKSKPVDYWQRSKDPKQYKNNGSNDLRTASRFDELEERILTDKDRIKPANKYIIAVEVLNAEPESLPVLKKMCNDLGIQFYAYDNANYFSSSVKTKALNVVPAEGELKGYDEFGINTSLIDILAYLTYKDDDLKEKIFNGLSKSNIDLQSIRNKVDELQKSKINYYLRNYDEYYVTDFANSLNATLHNSKNSTNNILRYVVREFGLDMKKHGVNSIKEYLTYKTWKGKKLQKDFNNEFNKKILNVVDNLYMEKMNELKENRHYAEVGGEYYENVYDYPPIKNLLDSKINELKKFYSDYILKNNDMFKYYYQISSDYARKHLNLGEYSDDKYDPQFDNVLAGVDVDRNSVDARDLIQILKYLIHDVDSFTHNEIKEMQEEYNKQF